MGCLSLPQGNVAGTTEKPLPVVKNEEEANDYGSSTTVSSKKIGIVSVNMADNNHNNDLSRCMNAQEQTFRAQQVAPENIQQMFA